MNWLVFAVDTLNAFSSSKLYSALGFSPFKHLMQNCSLIVWFVRRVNVIFSNSSEWELKVSVCGPVPLLFFDHTDLRQSSLSSLVLRVWALLPFLLIFHVISLWNADFFFLITQFSCPEKAVHYDFSDWKKAVTNRSELNRLSLVSKL